MAPGGALVRGQIGLVGAGVLPARDLGELERRHQPGQVGQRLCPESQQVLLEDAGLAVLLAHELALVTRDELVARDEAAHVEVLHRERLDVHRARPAAAAVVVGRLHEREAADGRVGVERRDRPLEPARLELQRVVDAHEVVALDEVEGAVEAAVSAVAGRRSRARTR